MLRKFLLTFLIFLFTVFSVSALENLNFNGFISDNADIISENNKMALNGILLDLQNKTKVDLAVVTLKSLNGKPVEDVSIEIAREKGLGDKKLNNGALVLVSIDDREARIEIGYGLEGYINDAKAGRIMDTYMIPYFKEGNYEKGIIDGTLALAYDIAKAYNVELSYQKPDPPIKNDIDFWFLLFIILLIMMTNRGGPGFWIGGGSGGGSGISFGGGGGFGGGGASRRW